MHSIDMTTNIPEVIQAQLHLSEQQHMDLLCILQKFPKLFDGSLGLYTKRKFHIDLKDDAVPFHVRAPYSVPVQNLPVLKQELDRQCDRGILERCGESKWGMPMMVIPKKMAPSARLTIFAS